MQPGIGYMVNTLSPLLPGIPVPVVAFRVETMLGMTVPHILSRAYLADKYGIAAGGDEQHLIDDLIRFFSAALTAPTELSTVNENLGDCR